MGKWLAALLLAVSVAYAAPVEVTSCPFLMESDMQYVVTADMACDTFPFTFIDLSLGPVNSSVNLNGHTIDVLFTNFISDFETYYDIEVYNGSTINCGVDGGGCIQWGGSGGGRLYLHHMTLNTTGNFITTSINELSGTQRIENINVNQANGYIITGWFLDLQLINTTATAVDGAGVFAVDGGNYFLDPFRHDGYAVGNSDFDISGDGVGLSNVTLLDADINPLLECGSGCDLVTWTVLDVPSVPIEVTTDKELILKFKQGDDSVQCKQCDDEKSNGKAVVNIRTDKTVASGGCDYISSFLSAVSSLTNPFKRVSVDRDICSDNSILSSMPILNSLILRTASSKDTAVFNKKG